MRTFLSAVAFAAALCAQDKASPYRFVPKDAFVVARCSGPAAWREQFQKTQVLKLIQGTTAAPLRAAITEGWSALMTEMRQQGKVDVDAFEQALLGYSGEVVVGLTLDMDTLPQAIADHKEPSFTLVISYAPDGHTDFAPLMAQMTKAAEEDAGDQLRDLPVGDLRLRCFRHEPGGFTLPFLHDGYVVLIASTDLEKAAPKVLAGDGGYTPPAGAAGPLALHVELAAAIEAMIGAASQEASRDGAPFDVEQLLRGLGLDSLQRFDLAVATDGPHVLCEFSVGFDDGDRGLFGILPAAAKRPRLTDVLPPGCEQFSVSALDLGALWRTIEKAWTGIGPAVPLTYEDAMAAFTEACKVRLKEDLLDHVGGEVLVVSEAAAGTRRATGADGDNEAAAMSQPFAGTCIALALKDGKAFGESLEKLVRSRGLHASRKTEDYAGVKVHKLRLLGAFEHEYTVTDDMLLLGPGGGGEQLRSVLDQRAARAAGKAAELPIAVKGRVQSLPDGWVGLSATSVPGLVEALTAVLSGAAASGASELRHLPIDVVLKALPSLRSELRQLDLESFVGATYTSGRTYRSVVRW